MAANATAFWRLRPSGNNSNGGGFDCAISPAATGTHGSFTGTTFTDETAAAFTVGMVGSSVNIVGVGQYLITARIDASNITLGSGNPGLTLSDGMAWTVGAGQDYSQQNSAQVSQSNPANTSTATVTLTDTGAVFTSALIGNAIQVSGTGITTIFTFITDVPSPTTLTLQTSPGTTGTTVSYNIGGGWASLANTTTLIGAVVPGNTIYLLGSGTPNPASYTFDFILAAVTPAPGTAAGGLINFANDPATPGYKAAPDTTGGMPCLSAHASTCISSGYHRFTGLYFVGTFTAAIAISGSGGASNPSVFGCVYDSTTYTGVFLSNFNLALGCEAFTSTGTAGSTLYAFTSGGFCIGCNVHDFNGGGISNATVINCIVAKNKLDGIKCTAGFSLIGNTIDGNLLNGIEITTQAAINSSIVMNNIISNHTVAGKFGLTCGAGSAPANTGFRIDYNVFYNNNADLNGVSYGPHDTHGGSNPYTGQATENYALA